MTATIVPCVAGFEGCDAMRTEAVAKHPRTARLAECKHMPIPPENPERLQGPEIGALCVFQSRSRCGPELVRVTERSYVWGPGDPSYHGGSRRYDVSIIAFGSGKTLLVDDKELTEVQA